MRKLLLLIFAIIIFGTVAEAQYSPAPGVATNPAITGATKTKITYDSKGLVTSGADIGASDLPSGIDAAKIANGSVNNTKFQYLGNFTSDPQTQLNAKESTANKDAASGYAGLDASSLLKAVEFPAFTGDATTSAGSVNITLASVITAGSCTVCNLTWDAKGRVTVAASGTAAPSAANPTASVGLSAVNGAASTFMRSDAAPALDQSIAPTWTGIHIFSSGKFKTPTVTPTADSTTAVTYTKADGTTAIGVWDTTNGRLRIGSGVAPTVALDVTGSVNASGNVTAAADVVTGSSGEFIVSGKSRLQMSTTSAIFYNTGRTGYQMFSLGAAAPSTIGSAPTHSQGYTVLQSEELLTIAAAATSTTTMQVPAGAVVLSVSVRVTTVIPTATTFTVSIGSISFQTAAISTAANTTDVGTNPVNVVSVYPYIPTAAGIVITPNLTPADATGRVRVHVVYYVITPPQS